METTKHKHGIGRKRTVLNEGRKQCKASLVAKGGHFEHYV